MNEFVRKKEKGGNENVESSNLPPRKETITNRYLMLIPKRWYYLVVKIRQGD
jgi:hypothetical protein